jgi:hypothetical protein
MGQFLTEAACLPTAPELPRPHATINIVTRLGLALLVFAPLSCGQDLSQAALELAIHIPPGDLTLSVRNLSSFDPSHVSEARRAFEANLRSRGVRIVEAAPASLRLTIAESLKEIVLSAEIFRDGARDVFLASARREAARQAGAGFTLERRLLWEQESVILDAAGVGDLIYVLEPARLAAYRNRQPAGGVALGPLPPSRDPRGRLTTSADAFVARLSAGSCRISPALDRSVCSVADPLPPAGPVESAAIDAPCGRYALVTRPTEPSEPDAIQAYDAAGKIAGDPLEFAGPVTALWSTDLAVTAIAKNLRTGNYAAYRITIACGQ